MLHSKIGSTLIGADPRTTIALDNVDTTYIDKLFGEPMQPVAALEVAKIPYEHRILWCHKRGIYTFPTIELIKWLKEQIDGRPAIEICCGAVALGQWLDIPFSDSFANSRQALAKAIYEVTGQNTPTPHPACEDLDANAAVSKYQPKVVIGSWCTQRSTTADEQGSVFGVDEAQILAKCDYIHVGNKNSHGRKRIRVLPHEEFSFPWLFTRAIQPELNEILIWKQQPIHYLPLDPKIISGRITGEFNRECGCRWCHRELEVSEIKRSMVELGGFVLICPLCIEIKYGPDAVDRAI